MSIIEKRGVTSQTVTKVFAAIIIASLGYVGYSMAYQKNSFFEERIARISVSSKRIKGISRRQEKDYSSFVRELKTKKIFSPVYRRDTVSGAVDQKEIAEKILDRLSTLLENKDPHANSNNPSKD